MTTDELLRIATIWGFSVDLYTKPGGWVIGALSWDRLKFTEDHYNTKQRAVDTLYNIIEKQIETVVGLVEDEREKRRDL